MKKKIPADLLSTYDCMYMFGVRVQAIIRWRHTSKFPYYHISGTAKCPPVRYSLKEVLAWAKKTNRMVLRSPTVQKKSGVVHWPSEDQKKFEAHQKGILL